MVEEKLSDVRDRATGVGAVVKDAAVEIADNVCMCRAPSVVSWECGGELSNSIRVGGGQAAEEGFIEVGLVGGVTVAAGDNSRVDAGGVAVPDIPGELWDRLAAVNFDELGVENEVDTSL